MRCKSVKIDDRLVITISGDVEGPMMLKLKKQIRSLLSEEVREFVFDLRDLAVESRMRIQTFLLFFRKASGQRIQIRIEGGTPLVASDLDALRNGNLRLG